MEGHEEGLHPAWWTLILVILTVVALWLTYSLFFGTFRAHETVTLTSERSGLVMETGAKVKLRGVQVGRVSAIQGGSQPVALKLEIDKDKIKFIPANIEGQIRATTVFGAKFVDLVYPEDPKGQLQAGQVIESRNVTVEANTVFQNVVDIIKRIDVAKLNSTLSALADGVRGQGERIGQATTDANQVLLELNPRNETIAENWRALRDFNDTYSVAAQDILTTLDALSTTSTTITNRATQLDALLMATTGLSNSGISLLAPNQANLIKAINVLEPTTNLLHKYSPSYTCLLTGAKTLLDTGGYDAPGGNGRTLVLDVGLTLGDDPYHYPDNLPVIGAKGGPGGKPSCGSLPDVAKNWPVRNLVTNTGFGTGIDWRPNPGIGFPAWANYLPTTRAVPEPPSIRNLFGGPAIGPIPYPGAPAYGADLYAPDGTPLWPGLPPAPPPMAPRDPGPTPGSEPFIVQHPAQMQPTPLPPVPLPREAAPSP
ncbi:MULTISPECIES: MCE family protein [Mycolicibacterium]|jgi:phospholipid/cholesterol/gamma-HCH transport system substrate-binding protein|uniref:Virulence factor Mce family protein n=2 Tax=Mycolicibacterium TaxID=1866885 RepID=A1TDX9_MYCVP|nr:MULTISPECIES: MCE family protein [Mycolicibacterium]ABM15379.1 virulence factor Mce family protein [Mycolicibacterium vanbaalenii PYR-1]MCV7128768.1 MCE family protein [Mycolicibacterium vanbaalenii PYR-1]MDN4522560.1 MCE family protein [Mycolicibacterium austroafricanum]MDW5614349.1 MCE family protein [Mycolicibacterium sp. D5.8-2]PQP48881.1 MCE family protein [Mycolicibacterium austroafricanum]